MSYMRNKTITKGKCNIFNKKLNVIYFVEYITFNVILIRRLAFSYPSGHGQHTGQKMISLD